MDTEKYIGRLLDDRYEILEVIGVGGMAVVYKARCHRLNRFVAIKVLKDDLYQDAEFRRRFHGESQAVAMLSHSNIMAVYDVSATDSADYIVMELIDGITLKQYMEKKGVLNWKETLHFAMQIAKALEHAHSRGIVHRDIKPHNIMVLKNGSVKVTDFGIAQVMSSANTLTKEALGSVHYISPEQAKGGRVDNRSDIYSLGVVMYEMMTGRPPYDGEAPVAVAIQHINGGAVMPSVLNPNIPGGLEQIIMKAMAQDPAKRYLTATSLLYDLEELRKNPGMLFDATSLMEDTTTRIDTAAARAGAASVTPPQPKTTAERIAGSHGERSVSRQTSYDGNTAYRAKREAEKERQRLNRNRAITTAVVAGSVVAVVAIIIFMVMLLNGGMSPNPQLVDVPELIGEFYDRLDETDYPNLELSIGDYVFSEEFEDGQIVDQKPAGGTQVPVGSEVKIYISMGPEQADLPKILDLKDMTPEAAQNYLRALGGELQWVLAQENSDEVSEGYVTRTEPAQGTQLVPGQTVTIFVSAGPEKKLAQVPSAVIGLELEDAIDLLDKYGFEVVDSQEEDDLAKKGTVLRVVDENGVEIAVGKDLDVTTKLILVVSSGEKYAEMPAISTSESGLDAKDRLEEMGFTKVSLEEEYHDTVAEGNVIRSNIPAGTKVDVTTAIILTVSKGPKPTLPPPPTTEPPTEPPTQPTEAQVTKRVVIHLPTDKTEAYVLTVMFHGEKIAESEIQPGTETFELDVSGSGTGYLEIYFDGTYIRTEKVEFRG